MIQSKFIETEFGALKIDFNDAAILMDYKILSAMNGENHKTTKELEDLFPIDKFEQQHRYPTVKRIALLQFIGDKNISPLEFSTYGNKEICISGFVFLKLRDIIAQVEVEHHIIFSPQQVQSAHIDHIFENIPF